MLYFHCTLKLLRAMDLPNPAPPEEISDSPLGVWYATIISFDQLIFLLFVNDPSLYTILLHYYKMPRSGQVFNGFKETLAVSLASDGIQQGLIRHLLQDHEQAVFVKTASRSMLGSMNDLVDRFLFELENEIANHNAIDLHKIQSELNQMPQRKVGWRYAVEAMLERLQTLKVD
jgi:hypothetical protein